MTNKKFIIFLFLISLIFSLFIGCSDDPMVAPTKLFILGIGNDKGKVFYDSDYNARIIFLKIGEASVVEVISNRLYPLKDTSWSSNIPDVATVSKKSATEEVIKACGYGASMISVYSEEARTIGVCYVIVNDTATDDGINIKIDEMIGLIKSSNEEYEINAISISELTNKHLILHYDNIYNIVIGKVEWYVNGVYVSNENIFDLTLSSFGTHNIDCIVYREINGTMIPVGTSSVEINANNN